MRTVLANGTVQNASDTALAVLKNIDEDDFPCAIAAKESNVLIGTTKGNMYLISRNSSGIWSVDRFQKNRNVLFGILRSGAKLLGLTPGDIKYE